MTEVRNRNPTSPNTHLVAIKALLLEFLDKYSYKDLYADHCLNALVKGASSLLLAESTPSNFAPGERFFRARGVFE